MSLKNIFSLVLILLFSVQTFAKLKVLIDPGHGGEDQGATHNNVKEKTVTLAVAKLLFEDLKMDSKFQPLLTRTADQFVALDDRTKKAEDSHADVFISIHANSSPATSAKGTEIYFESQNPTDEESFFLANRENNVKAGPSEEPSKSDLKNILTDLNHSNHMTMSSVLSQNLLEALQKNLQIKTRAIRQAPFRVLGVTMPATLIELGFLSNSKEAQWLTSHATQKNIVTAIHKGLIVYKEKLDKLNAKP